MATCSYRSNVLFVDVERCCCVVLIPIRFRASAIRNSFPTVPDARSVATRYVASETTTAPGDAPRDPVSSINESKKFGELL